jgi:hypothetical protein
LYSTINAFKLDFWVPSYNYSHFLEHITGSLIRELIESACLLLTKSNDKEIISSSLNFVRTLCIIFNEATLAQYLPDLLNALIYLKDAMNRKFTSQRIRAEMKIILKKLVKKFTFEIIYEKLMSLIDPARTTVKQDFMKQMSSLKKNLEHEKKVKASKEETGSKKEVDLISMYSKATSAKVQNNEIEHLLEDSDSDSESEDEDKFSKKSGKTDKSTKSKDGKKEKSRAKAAKANAWITENDDDEEPLNLLDPMAIRNVMATKPLTQAQIKKKKDKEVFNKTKNRGFKVNQDGRLIIKDENGKGGDGGDESGDSDDEIIDNKSRILKKKEKIRRSASENLNELMDTLSLSKQSTKSTKSTKSSRSKKGGDGESVVNTDGFSYKTGGTGIHRNLNQQKRKTISFGEDYKAKVSC